jgi:hypothetical protein
MAAVVAVQNRSPFERRRLLLRAAALWYLFIYKGRKRNYSRSVWTRQWLLRRDDLGAYSTLLSELKAEDQGSFLNFLRLSPGLFDQMVEKVSPYIQRQDTCFRKAISPGMRLAITLRYLATGIILYLMHYISHLVDLFFECVSISLKYC